jgi:hypothetical protein
VGFLSLLRLKDRAPVVSLLLNCQLTYLELVYVAAAESKPAQKLRGTRTDWR